MTRRRLLTIIPITLSVLLCLGVARGDEPKDEMMELYGLFVDAIEQVESSYVRPVDRKELLEHALQGMLEDLDQHSSYFSESQWAQFRKQLEGSFVGIGVSVEIDTESNQLKVLAPLPGAPAYEAGILPGDLILAVDGKSTEGMSRDQAIEALQGRPGTQVKLKVHHVGKEEPATVTITRAIIEYPNVMGDRRKPDDTWDFLLDKEHKIGYVRITNFVQNTADELREALDQLTADGMQALILDLRDNPGGLLSAAVEISDMFIKDGKIVTTKGRNTRDKVYEAHEAGTYDDFPVAILINQHSASASEIVAACLQDHDRAIIVGQRSYGKGSVQNIFPLGNGDNILKLTVATYWRPSGKNIHRFKPREEAEDEEWGVSPTPGLNVELDADEYKAWIEYRQRRDLISKLNPTRQPPEGEEARENDPDTDQINAPGKVPDRQLDKALDALKKELSAKKTDHLKDKAAE